MNPLTITNAHRVLQAITLVEQGYTLSDACDRTGISYREFKLAVEANRELAEAAGAAEQRSYDMMAEALLRIDVHPVYGQSDAKMASVISNNIKWFLSKRRSSTYGDKVLHEHTITADRAILDALTRGKDRAQGRIPVERQPETAITDIEYTPIPAAPAKSIEDELKDLF